MAEYISREEIEKKARHRKELGFPCVDIIDIHETPTADVIERSKYEEVVKEAEELSKAYSNERGKYKDLRFKIDKAIEEIEDKSYLSYDDNPRRILDEDCVLAILNKLIAESEEK